MSSSCSVEKEVMTRNYAKLCEVLSPMIDSMLPKLLSEKVITYEEKSNISVKSTGTYKVEALLDGSIKTSLSIGYQDSFYKLLTVMKDTRSAACIRLVDSMIGELPSDLVTKFNLTIDGDKSNDHNIHVTGPAFPTLHSFTIPKLTPKSSAKESQQPIQKTPIKLTPKSCAKESQQPIQKTPITLLQEYCQQRKIQSPSYDIQAAEKDGGGFYSRVTVEGKMYLGSTRPGKKEAKQSAAEKAIELHIGTSSPDDTTKPSPYKSSQERKQTNFDRMKPGSHKIPSTSYVQELKQKYFDRKSIPYSFQKRYFDTKPVDGGFQCILKIPRQRDFKSAVLPSKSAAENDAAKCALEFLQL